MITINEGITKINAFIVLWNFNTHLKQFRNTLFEYLDFIKQP
jgi:hypothetical protein